MIQLQKVVDDPALALKDLRRDDFADRDEMNRFVQEERSAWGEQPHPLSRDGDERPGE